MKATVIFILDAHRASYIDNHAPPYLSMLKNKYCYYDLTPSFGFCERSEIFTGLCPLESDNLTAIGHDPKNSPYNTFRLGFNILSKVLPKSQDHVINKFTRKLLKNKDFI